MDPLDDWIEQTCPKLASEITIHVDTFSGDVLSWKDQEDLVRCIMTSIRDAWPTAELAMLLKAKKLVSQQSS